MLMHALEALHARSRFTGIPVETVAREHMYARDGDFSTFLECGKWTCALLFFTAALCSSITCKATCVGDAFSMSSSSYLRLTSTCVFHPKPSHESQDITRSRHLQVEHKKPCALCLQYAKVAPTRGRCVKSVSRGVRRSMFVSQIS